MTSLWVKRPGGAMKDRFHRFRMSASGAVYRQQWVELRPSTIKSLVFRRDGR